MITVNLLSAFDYLNAKNSLYQFYPIIINSLHVIEAIVLMLGAPFIGITNGLVQLWSDFAYSSTSNDSNLQRDNSIYSVEKEECKQ